jgi:hypothetical protein
LDVITLKAIRGALLLRIIKIIEFLSRWIVKLIIHIARWNKVLRVERTPLKNAVPVINLRFDIYSTKINVICGERNGLSDAHNGRENAPEPGFIPSCNNKTK